MTNGWGRPRWSGRKLSPLPPLSLCVHLSPWKNAFCCGFRILKYFLLTSWVSPNNMLSFSMSNDSLNVTLETWVTEQVFEPTSPPSSSTPSGITPGLLILTHFPLVFAKVSNHFYDSQSNCWELSCPNLWGNFTCPAGFFSPIVTPTNCLKMDTGEWGWGTRENNI